MLPSGSTLKEVRNRFRWDVPDRYNMAVDVCDRWAETQGDRVAIIHDHGDRIEEVSFSELRDRSNRLASILVELGLARGDRVGILLPQNPWTATAHIAVWKMAGISIPLFTLFGEEALEYRLNDSAARAIVTNAEGLAKLSGIRDRLPNLERILCIDGPCPGALYLPAMIAGASARFDTVV